MKLVSHLRVTSFAVFAWGAQFKKTNSNLQCSSTGQAFVFAPIKISHFLSTYSLPSPYKELSLWGDKAGEAETGWLSHMVSVKSRANQK